MIDLPLGRYVEVRKALAPALSPDGRTLAFVSDLTGFLEAFRHTSPGSEPVQLTEFRERVGGFVQDDLPLLVDDNLVRSRGGIRIAAVSCKDVAG